MKDNCASHQETNNKNEKRKLSNDDGDDSDGSCAHKKIKIFENESEEKEYQVRQIYQ